MRTIGISIPTYERPEITFDAFSKVYSDKRVECVTISDDCSSIDCFIKLSERSRPMVKVKLHRNITNLDCYENKMRATWLSDSDWNILLDSDNQIDESYIDRLFEIDVWDKETIYTPEFARPQFDFREYAGLTITKENVASYIHRPMFETCLNACNFFVYKKNYMNVWASQNNIDPVTSDSIFMAYKWLEAGFKIHIVKGMQYDHRVWEGSHYRQNISRTPRGFHESVLQKLRALK